MGQVREGLGWRMKKFEPDPGAAGSISRSKAETSAVESSPETKVRTDENTNSSNSCVPGMGRALGIHCLLQSSK